MSDKDSDGEGNVIEMEASAEASLSASASISYSSAFSKKQLKFAKDYRDRAGEIEAQFENSTKKLPRDMKREHQRNVVSAVVNSLAFLEGQKHWFRERLKEEKWNDIEYTDKLDEEVDWRNHLEDAFVDIIKVIEGESTLLDDSKPYNHIEALRRFRNSLLHFKSPMVKAGEEEQKYQAHKELQELDFPQNSLGANNTYPFNWLTYELAERSVRMSFTVWRFFGRELGKEDEFLKGVPSP